MRRNPPSKLLPGVTAFLLGVVSAASARPAANIGQDTRRFASICLTGDQLLLQLVPREEIAALSWLAADPDLSPRWREARSLPAVRGGAEELLALKPDLVLAGAYSTPQTKAMLRKLGIPVLEIGIPNDFADLREQILSVGASLGVKERAEAIVRELDGRLVHFSKARESGSPPKALFVFADGSVPGGGTFPDAVLRAAGFENLGAILASKKPGGRERPVALESILLSRPDLVIFTAYHEGDPTFNGHFAERGIWRRLPFRKETVPFRQLATPDVENLSLVERLQTVREELTKPEEKTR